MLRLIVEEEPDAVEKLLKELLELVSQMNKIVVAYEDKRGILMCDYSSNVTTTEAVGLFQMGGLKTLLDSEVDGDA